MKLSVSFPYDSDRENNADFYWIVGRRYVVDEDDRQCFDERDNEKECLESGGKTMDRNAVAANTYKMKLVRSTSGRNDICQKVGG